MCACLLAACAPMPVETDPHQVPVEVKREDAAAGLDAARFRAVSGDGFVQDVIKGITTENNEVNIVASQDFMAGVFSGRNTATLGELDAAAIAERIDQQSLTHIVLIEHRHTGNTMHGELAAVATIINTAQLSAPETLSLDAEGYRRGLSLPLPYIFLFFPYSDPDVYGSATGRMASAIAEKMQQDARRPLALTILTSDNLLALIANAYQQQSAETEATSEGDPMDDMKSPLGLYSMMMSDAREEGEWVYYNPLAHVQLFLTSLLVAPMMVVVDAAFDDEASAGISGGEQARNREWTQYGHALEAIRKENWQAGYRLLEDFIITDDTTLQARTIQLFADYPELLEAAPATFSRGSLQESRKTYGDTAADLEQHRLNLYEKVARQEDHALALENFRDIFQVSPDTRETASH